MNKGYAGVLAASAILIAAVVLSSAGCSQSEIMMFSSKDQKLYKIDEKCTETLVADLSSSPYPDASALTFISKDEFYLWTGDSMHLLRWDISNPASPSYVDLGEISVGGGGFALCKDGNLYTVSTQNQLYIIDQNTLEATPVGDGLGITVGTEGLSCHPQTDDLYLYAGAVGGLYIVDKTTGRATLVGYSGIIAPAGVGLEFDPQDATKLYASLGPFETNLFYLYKIDPQTGAAQSLCYLPHGNRNLGARVVKKTPSLGD
jgi:hypothetical protein